MNHVAVLWIIFIAIFFEYCYCVYQPVKTVVLTTSTSQLDGATINAIKDTTCCTNNAWTIAPTDQTGYHMQIDLNNEWGFRANELSSITMQIDGTTTLNTGDLDLILSFSVNHNQYITMILGIDHQPPMYENDHQIYPPCGYNAASGDVKSCVDTSYCNGYSERECKATGGCSDSSDWDTENRNIDNYWPLIIVLENDAAAGTLTAIYTNPTWQATSFQMQCQYNTAFATDQGLQIYIGLDDTSERISLTSFTIIYSYDLSANPTSDPTANPTSDPSSVPTNVPTNIPTTVNPTTATPTTAAPTTATPTTVAPTTSFPIATTISDTAQSSTSTHTATTSTAASTMQMATSTRQTTTTVTIATLQQTGEESKRFKVEYGLFQNLSNLVVVILIILICLCCCCILILLRTGKRKEKVEPKQKIALKEQVCMAIVASTGTPIQSDGDCDTLEQTKNAKTTKKTLTPISESDQQIQFGRNLNNIPVALHVDMDVNDHVFDVNDVMSDEEINGTPLGITNNDNGENKVKNDDNNDLLMDEVLYDMKWNDNNVTIGKYSNNEPVNLQKINSYSLSMAVEQSNKTEGFGYNLKNDANAQNIQTKHAGK